MKERKWALVKVLSWVLIIAMVSGLTLAAARVIAWKLFWLETILIAALAYFVVPKLKAGREG